MLLIDKKSYLNCTYPKQNFNLYLSFGTGIYFDLNKEEIIAVLKWFNLDLKTIIQCINSETFHLIVKNGVLWHKNWIKNII